jgi:hypothetical protein
MESEREGQDTEVRRPMLIAFYGIWSSGVLRVDELFAEDFECHISKDRRSTSGSSQPADTVIGRDAFKDFVRWEPKPLRQLSRSARCGSAGCCDRLRAGENAIRDASGCGDDR